MEDLRIDCAMWPGDHLEASRKHGSHWISVASAHGDGASVELDVDSATKLRDWLNQYLESAQ